MCALNFSAMAAVVMDMDGTLWRGQTALPGLRAWFDFLAARRLPYLLATNSANWPPESYVAKLAGLGVALPPDLVLTSALATADWLRERQAAGAAVHVVGSQALRDALSGAGFQVLGGEVARVAAVVAGIDLDLTYAKIRDAARLIRAGASFVGTNPDPTYPTEAGLTPGAGVVLAAIQVAAGVVPEIVGKPERPMFETALRRLGTPAPRTLMIGDRLDTDILGAQRCGMPTAWVTRGVDGPEAVAASGIVPSATFCDLDELRRHWLAAESGGNAAPDC